MRPRIKPWHAEHAAGRITWPLPHNGQPYSGINILMLWAAATAQGYITPIWTTFRQARELGAHVRKGEKRSPVVDAVFEAVLRVTGRGAMIAAARLIDSRPVLTEMRPASTLFSNACPGGEARSAELEADRKIATAIATQLCGTGQYGSGLSWVAVCQKSLYS